MTRKKNKNSLNMKGEVIFRVLDDNKNVLFTQDSITYPNLITLRGRSYTAQRVFGLDLGQNPDDLSDYSKEDRKGWKDYHISLFAIGTGGTTESQPFTPIPVSPSDVKLTTHGTVSGEPGNYITFDLGDGRGLLEYKYFDSGFPKFTSDTEILLEDYENLPDVSFNDPYYEEPDTDRKADSFLIGVIRATLSKSEANSDGEQKISEAGLFLANDRYVEGESTPDIQDVQLFSRTTFPTKLKNNQEAYEFEWFIFF